MYCVIQEIELKRNSNGYSKEIVSEYMQVSYDGQDFSHWIHYYSHEHYERPIKKAYKVSIHKSYRENGKVKKKQCSLCTIGYYDLAESIFTIYDYCEHSIEKASLQLEVSVDYLYDLVEQKLTPLTERIKREFMQTEEYQTHIEHKHILSAYQEKKKEFAKLYGVDEDKYDMCYDVFGALKNPDVLKHIQDEHVYRQEYERKSKEYRSSYDNSYYSNYSNSYESGCYGSFSSNYESEERQILKKFYRELSRKFHPDSNPDKDTSSEMKLLNKLKEQWGA